MNLDLSVGLKEHFSAVLDNSADMNFKTQFMGRNVTIAVLDEGSLPSNSPCEYNFRKRINVFDEKNDLLFFIEYQNYYSSHANNAFLNATLQGDCPLGMISVLLNKINQNKVQIAQEKEHLIQRVVARVMSGFSKVRTNSAKR